MCDINSRYVIIVSREKCPNIFISKKLTIFLPAATKLFKVIKNKREHVINIFISIFNKLKLAGMGKKKNSAFLVFKQKTKVSHRNKDKAEKCLTNVHSCICTHFRVILTMFKSPSLLHVLSHIFDVSSQK